MRNVYLSSTSRLEALDRFLENVEIEFRQESIPVREALGRVTSAPVFARLSMPGFHSAAMDGIAVLSSRTYAASDQSPLLLQAGEDYKAINTGEALPENFDAVIKIEDTQEAANGGMIIINPVPPWQHVRPVGEDVVTGEMIIPARHRMRPQDLGALLAGGVTNVEVTVPPRVAVIPSGSELVDPGIDRVRGAVPDFNSTVIAAYLQEWGATAVILPIVPDELPEIRAALVAALKDYDLVIINAGSSAGEKDYTKSVLEDVGEVLLHGVATRPGKPTILGRAGHKAVVGLPGFPISAYLSLEWFVQPLIFRHFGLPVPKREKLTATLGRRVLSTQGLEEFVRMTAGYVNDRYVANPLDRGAGVTMSLVRADALLVIESNSLGHEMGEEVELELYRPEKELRHNLLAAGSHDLVIDLLATALKEHDPKLHLSSAHLGSMGGITAVGRGLAHIAGVHLYDPVSGDYNRPYIEKMFPAHDLHLVNLVYRMQGWIVPSGNPDRITHIKDLAAAGLSFVNRQKGSGTRLLFDYLLGQAGLAPDRINGYAREEHTHLNVAAAVAAGAARVGLGILPAARAFGLDFIPLAEERYDLLMGDTFFQSPVKSLLIDIITKDTFRSRVEALGGYSMRDTGKILL